MPEDPQQATLLSWCADCRRYSLWHPLIHQLEHHAPRIGDRKTRPEQRSWRTAALKERAA